MNEKESRLDNVEHRRLFEQKILDDAALETKTSFEHPKAIILAGQPGSEVSPHFLLANQSLAT
ncbi:hypothetical protein ABFU49_03620 [Xanthomonas campestris pv. campestris]|uniref:hypothetical protein n=1 Tax=Xanthomonas campestris TaxID=339 RepID=UPI00389010C6